MPGTAHRYNSNVISMVCMFSSPRPRVASDSLRYGHGRDETDIQAEKWSEREREGERKIFEVVSYKI